MQKKSKKAYGIANGYSNPNSYLQSIVLNNCLAMKKENMLFSKGKSYEQPSAFEPENLLREARRQNAIPLGKIPPVCVLDPDGDMVNYLVRSGMATLDKYWAGYHTKMYEFENQGTKIGIVGCAVGASYAVLVAEQMFVSGCELLISITSAGIITPPIEGTKFIVIKKALRDEGTSYHYLPPTEEAVLAPILFNQIQPLLGIPELALYVGDSWTTDAPYREYAKSEGVTAVEMEASALYAFAKARQKRVICFAHLTNNMAQDGDDFEKGIENGSVAALELIYQTISCLYSNDG